MRNSTNKMKKKIEESKLKLLYQTMKYIYSLMNADESDLKEDYNQIFKKISNSYKQIEIKEDQNEQSMLSAFFLFYAFLGVQIFDERANTMQILDEVNECFKRFRSVKLANNDLHWVDVFTDIILSLLSRAGSLKRTVSEEVFALISKEITKTGLQQLMTALISDGIEISDNEDEEVDEEDEFMDAKEELSEGGSENEDEEEEEDDDEDEDDENHKLNKIDEEEEIDLEIDENCANVEKMKVYDSRKDEESESDEELSDLNESDNESVDEEFRKKIKEALGKAAIDDEEEEEEEIVFDDEQMFKFDEAISKVFKEKKMIKNKTKELTEFKSRCLDLVQILLNSKNKDLNFLIEIAKNTLQVLVINDSSKSFDLMLKASATLKKYQKIEQSKINESSNELNELNDLLKTSVKLVNKLPEKIRNNLNSFIIWLLDLCKSDAVENFILNDLDKKLNKSSEISLLVQLAERKKQLAHSIFNQLFKINLTFKLTNFELCSFYKLITACFLKLDQSIVESTQTDLLKILSNSLDILNKKKNDKKAKFLVEELIRFLTAFLKNNLELVKQKKELISKLNEIGYESVKLSKKLRQKWKATLKSTSSID